MAFRPLSNILVNDMKSIFDHFLQCQATYGPEDTFKFKSIKFKGKGIPANYKINSDLENSSENNYEVGHPQKDHSIHNPVPIDACDANLPSINTNLEHPSMMIPMNTGNLVPSKAPCPCNLKTNELKHWQSLCDACDISYACMA